MAKDFKYKDFYNKVFDSLAHENIFGSLLRRAFSKSEFNDKG